MQKQLLKEFLLLQNIHTDLFSKPKSYILCLKGRQMVIAKA